MNHKLASMRNYLILMILGAFLYASPTWANGIANDYHVSVAVTSPVPVSKEVVSVPEGYQTCFNVSAGWQQEKWIPEHQVCNYENRPEGSSWTQGFWACTEVTEDGTCVVWEWNSAQWIKSNQ